MTFDMRYLHNNYEIYKSIFLNTYFNKSINDINEYLSFEKYFHIFTALEFIAFSLERLPNDKYLKDKINYLKNLIKEI